MTTPAAEHVAELDCVGFDAGRHDPRTKGAAGRCSWTEDCRESPAWSTTVTTATSRHLYALCGRHHARVHQYYPDATTTPEAEVQHLLEGWADGFAQQCRAEGTHPRDATRDRTLTLGRRGLDRDECASFLRAWRAGYVDIGIAGTFTLPGLRACPPELHLIGRNEDGTALHTEYLIQIGVVAELLEDHGWTADELAFEQGEFDALGHRDGRIQLAVEAKARPDVSDPDGLARLESSFTQLSHDSDHVASPNHARKWQALHGFTQEGSVHVLLVASGARWWMDAYRRPDGTTEVLRR